MKIKSITIRNFGPFYGDHTLELDPSVTVLTGPNDCGKTILLDALACTVSHQATIERRVNITRAEEVSGNRLHDQNLSAEIVVEVSPECIEAKVLQAPFRSGDIVTAQRKLGVSAAPGFTGATRDEKSVGVGGYIPKWNILRLPGDAFRQIIPLKSPSAVERAFLEIGFGANFADLPANLPGRWPDNIRKAESTLTRAIRRALPPTMPMDIRLSDGAPQNPDAIRISISDSVGELIGTDDRGAGIGRMLGLVGPLVLALRKQNAPLLILLDEPENSLHADMQHKLRRLLEEIAKNPMCQAVYATHSPSMINNMRPESIRLLSRAKVGEAPTSKIQNDPFSKNFALVRSALGVTPADSLLYAPVTVVVEGKTEVSCLPRMLEKLMLSGDKAFGDVNQILEQIHFLDGEGDSVEYFVRVAKSQNNKAIVFLDGEKRPKRGEDKLCSEHANVPVVKLDSGVDIEQLVPRDTYFQAVTACCSEDNSAADGVPGLSQEGFGQWVNNQKQRAKDNMFGRQIQDWLRESLSGPIPPKHQILMKAIELCSPEKIGTKKLQELLEHIRQALNS